MAHLWLFVKRSYFVFHILDCLVDVVHLDADVVHSSFRFLLQEAFNWTPFSKGVQQLTTGDAHTHRPRNRHTRGVPVHGMLGMCY